MSLKMLFPFFLLYAPTCPQYGLMLSFAAWHRGARCLEAEPRRYQMREDRFLQSWV